MFIAPTPREALKDVPPTIRVETYVSVFERRQNPENGSEEFADAADLALTEALENGYTSVSFENVAQFVKKIKGETVSEYVWMFSAWEPQEVTTLPTVGLSEVYQAAREGHRIAIITLRSEDTIELLTRRMTREGDEGSVRRASGQQQVRFRSGGVIDLVCINQLEQLRGRTYEQVAIEPLPETFVVKAAEHASPCVVGAENGLALIK